MDNGQLGEKTQLILTFKTFIILFSLCSVSEAMEAGRNGQRTPRGSIFVLQVVWLFSYLWFITRSSFTANVCLFTLQPPQKKKEKKKKEKKKGTIYETPIHLSIYLSIYLGFSEHPIPTTVSSG